MSSSRSTGSSRPSLSRRFVAGAVRSHWQSGLAVVGAATLLVGGVDLASYATTGSPVLLGHKNTESKATRIVTTGAGPALKLKATSGSPALAVNTTDLIKNLNADQLQGKTLDQVSPTLWTASIGTSGSGGTGAFVAYETRTLPTGLYEFSLGGVIVNDVGQNNICTVFDDTRLHASPTPDRTAIFIDTEVGNDVTPQVSGHFVGSVVHGNRLVFMCNIDQNSVVYQPVQLSVRLVDRATSVPGLTSTTYPRPSGRIFGGR